MFSSQEKRSIVLIASVYAFRMLGLFMVLPVFMLAGQDLAGATPLLLGLALGIYGLSQALLQVPFGLLSDRLGRRPLLIAGLLLFGAGGVVAAQADTIVEVIVGRFLQGAGAIASVLMAYLADLTREENRTKAMASIGMTIGLAFAASLILGPWLLEAFGLAGLFWSTVLAAGVGVILVLLLPVPVRARHRRDSSVALSELWPVLRDRELLRLDVGIFALHLALTSVFVATPVILQQSLGIPLDRHGWIYLVLMVVAFAGMIPLIVVGEKKQRVREIFRGAVLLLSLVIFLMALLSPAQVGVEVASQFGEPSAAMAVAQQASVARVDTNAVQDVFPVQAVFLFLLTLFFVAFNYLEATLPSLVSRLASAGQRGTAMGVYSSSQFLGAFLGGALGGIVLSISGPSGVYGMCALIGLLWSAVAWRMQPPPNTRSFMVPLDRFGSVPEEEIVETLAGIEGVEDVTLVQEEQAIYLKVDKAVFDDLTLMRHFPVSKA